MAIDEELYRLFTEGGSLRAVYNAGLDRAAQIARAEATDWGRNGSTHIALNQLAAAIEAEKGRK